MKSILDRIAKRDGLYVSRPVLNADAWAKWAEKYGVPNPVPAEEMHTTIIASRIDVKTKPSQMTWQVFTGGDSCYGAGHFAYFGPEANVLVYTWSCDWFLMDRYSALLSMGATSDWPELRPHIALSYDAKGFELSDEALASMPPSFLLGGETFAPFAPSTKVALEKSFPTGEAVRLEQGAVDAAVARINKAAVDGWDGLEVQDQQTVALISFDLGVTKAALERLEGKVEFATSPMISTIIKAVEEDRLVYGWASVSVAKGAGTADGMVKDSHRHKITTKAIRKLCHGLFRGQRAGKFDHKGLKKTDIVEGLVFDRDVWAAMGDYFEKIGELTTEQAAVFKGMTFEGLLLGFHCEDDSIWEIAKTTDFELSIGAEEATLQELQHG